MKVTVPYRKGHEGVLLSRIDPRAWTDTMQFPGTSYTKPPSRREVYLHVKDLQRRRKEDQLILSDRLTLNVWQPSVPVLWDFGKVYWAATRDIIVISDTEKEAT